MAVKINWHRNGTKLRHCHPMHTLQRKDTNGVNLSCCRQLKFVVLCMLMMVAGINGSATVELRHPTADQQLVPGVEVTLRCRTDGHPLPRVEWYRNRIRYVRAPARHPPCSVCLLALAVLIGRVRVIRCTLLISRCCIWQTGNTNSSTSSHLLVARTKSDYRLILFVIITYLLENAVVQTCTSVLEPEQVNKVRLKR